VKINDIIREPKYLEAVYTGLHIISVADQCRIGMN